MRRASSNLCAEDRFVAIVTSSLYLVTEARPEAHVDVARVGDSRPSALPFVPPQGYRPPFFPTHGRALHRAAIPHQPGEERVLVAPINRRCVLDRALALGVGEAAGQQDRIARCDTKRHGLLSSG